ncbi:MAG: hypothetical protein ABSA26_01610 [Thermoguttaceae bacterium]|jgi:hypothetical protein
MPKSLAADSQCIIYCFDGPPAGTSSPGDGDSLPDSSQSPFDGIEKACRKRGPFLGSPNKPMTAVASVVPPAMLLSCSNHQRFLLQ